MPKKLSFIEMLTCDKLQIEQMATHGLPKLRNPGGLNYTPQLKFFCLD
jgi:hypothetical protein